MLCKWNFESILWQKGKTNLNVRCCT